MKNDLEKEKNGFLDSLTLKKRKSNEKKKVTYI